MLDPTSERDLFDQENMEEISQLASLEMSGDVVANTNSSTVVLEKPSYPDSVYVTAANIFQGIRIQRSPDKVIINYGSEPLQPSSSRSEDESFQRLSYELAFSTLKCKSAEQSYHCDAV